MSSTNEPQVLDAGQDVAELAQRINSRVTMAETHAKKALEYALEIGELLDQARRQVAHGQWEQWLTANCNLAMRTARAYMQLAKAYPTLPEPERQRVADLPVREAIRAVTTVQQPKTERNAPIRTVSKRDDRDRAADVFRSAKNELGKAADRIAVGREINGAGVAKLRERLERVLQQLTELQQANVEGGAA